jgi:hypothetical protein
MTSRAASSVARGGQTTVPGSATGDYYDVRRAENSSVSLKNHFTRALSDGQVQSCAYAGPIQ